MAHYSRLGGTADSADFQIPITRPVSDDFRNFFAEIATKYSLTAGIRRMRVQRAFTTCFNNNF